MKKNKEGKVIASLTEVKNKTGDIFALADEYGEVTLTSYNKPRYKLIKLNISAILEEETPAVKRSSVKVVKKPAKDLHTEKPVEPETLIDKPIVINEWDRDSQSEQDFVDGITKALI